MHLINRVCRSILNRGLRAESLFLRKSLEFCGNRTRIRNHCVVYNPEKLSIEEDCDIGEFVVIRAGGTVKIGKRVLIAAHCIISSVGHPLALPRHGINTAEEIQIGNDVWLGAGSIVVPGVVIGEGSVVGAGAVVVSDIPAFSVAVGVPARVIKSIKQEMSKGSSS